MTPTFTVQEAPVAQLPLRDVHPGEFFIVKVGNEEERYLRLPDDLPSMDMEGKALCLRFDQKPHFVRFIEITEVMITVSEVRLRKIALTDAFM